MKKSFCFSLIFLISCVITTAYFSLSDKALGKERILRAAIFAETFFWEKSPAKKAEAPPEAAAKEEAPHDEIVFERTVVAQTPKENALSVSNLANADFNTNELLALPDEVKGASVLILHTHGCESYTPTEESMYTPSSDFRTVDTRYNVVRVGDEVEKILTESGIRVVHDKTLCDYPDYNSSYNNSYSLAQSYISSNPDIKVVLDIHRDSISDENGKSVKTVGEKNTAALMFVVGTDMSGNSHPLWRQNLSFALKLQKRLSEKYPTLMRPINLRTHRFNQQLSTGSLILEVGSDANTLEEALAGARLFAQELGAYLAPQ